MKKAKIIFLVFAIILVYFLANMFEIYNYSFIDEKQVSEVGIVLGAASYNGEVSRVYEERLNHSIELYNEGYIEKVIVTGGVSGEDEISEAEAAYHYLTLQGIPKEDVILEDKSTTTEENLLNSKLIMERKGYTESIIISDPLHMKRAILLSDYLELSSHSSPTKTSRYISFSTKMPFLIRETFLYIGYKWYNFFRGIF
ncbi:MAG: multidrug MFS transporter [Clostridiales bacterium]|nr:MAG: multidrug MFS transporter [Clostridiales bacterium]